MSLCFRNAFMIHDSTEIQATHNTTTLNRYAREKRSRSVWSLGWALTGLFTNLSTGEEVIQLRNNTTSGMVGVVCRHWNPGLAQQGRVGVVTVCRVRISSSKRKRKGTGYISFKVIL